MFDFRKVLFSMTVRQVKKKVSPTLGSLGTAHYSKHTRYNVDHEFAEHLKVCPICREQLLESLNETCEMIRQGVFW